MSLFGAVVREATRYCTYCSWCGRWWDAAGEHEGFGLLITEGRHRGSVLQDGRLFVHQKTEKTTGEQDSLEIRFPRSYLPSQQGLRSAARSSMPWGGM